MTVASCNMGLVDAFCNCRSLMFVFVDVEQFFRVLLNILWHVQNYKTVIDLFDTCYEWMKHIATVYYIFTPGIAQTKCCGFIIVHGH